MECKKTDNLSQFQEHFIEKLKESLQSMFLIIPFLPPKTVLYKTCLICIAWSLKVLRDMRDAGEKIDISILLKSIPIKLFNKIIEDTTVNGDKEKCILLGSDLLKEHNIKHGEWIKIVIANKFNSKFTQTIQVLDGGSQQVGKAIISDLSLFNIIQSEVLYEQEYKSPVTSNTNEGRNTSINGISKSKKNYYNSITANEYKLISIVRLNNYEPQFYTCMHLEYINSFHSCPNGEVLEQLLNNYFASPRYHHLNDVFRIDLKRYNLDIFKYNEVNYMCNLKYVYFKVCGMDIFDNVSIRNEDKTAEELDKSLENVNKNGMDSNNKTLRLGKINDMLIFLLKQNQHGGYISSKKTHISIVTSKKVQSFLPNVVERSALELQNANIQNLDKYVLPVQCPSQYFDKLLNYTKVFYYEGGGENVLNFQMKPIFLVTGSQNAGLDNMLSSVSDVLGVHCKQVDCISLIGAVPTIVEKNLENLFEKAEKCAPCMLILHNIEDLCTDLAGSEDIRAMNCLIQHLPSSFSRIVVVCTSSKPDNIHHQIKRLFLKTINVLPLTESERRAFIEYELKYLGGDYEFDSSLVDYLTANTAGFESHDLTCLVRLSVKNKLLEKQHDKRKNLKEGDFKKVYDDLQSRYSARLDAPSVPNVSWEDIGGLSKLKEEILSTFRAVSRKSGLKRSGLLLHGPPGTGKTLIAKAVATECRMNFLAVKGPELLNKYIGQSEENIRNVFLKARAAAPCVVFFDELDSLAPRRGQEDQSSGVMDRVVSQLLAEMDGVHGSKDVFILGATNRVDLLDPAILRPGRLDKSLCVGLYEDRSSQLGVLKAVVRKFQLDEGVRLEDLVHHFPAHMSGADIYSICSKAWTLAIRRIINTCPDQKTVTVTMEDFEGACPPQSVPEKTSPFQFAPDSPLLSPGSSANVAPEVMVS